jgi:hypothetical protein
VPRARGLGYESPGVQLVVSPRRLEQPSPADERLCGATVVIDIGIK